MAWSYVSNSAKRASGNGSGTASVTINSTTAGNLGVLVWRNTTNQSRSGEVCGSQSFSGGTGSFTTNNGSGPIRISIYYILSLTGGQTSCSVTLGGSTAWDMIFAEFNSGSTNSLDAATGNPSSGTGNSASPAVTSYTPTAGALIVGGTGIFATGTITSSALTIPAGGSGSNENAVSDALGYNLSASGATTAGFSGTSGQWAEVAASFTFSSGLITVEADEDSGAFLTPQQPYSLLSSFADGEDAVFPITIPTLAWDEIDWQQDRGVRVSELITQDEQPTEIPPIVIVWNPSIAYTQGDDWDWSKTFDYYAFASQYEHEEWPPAYAAPISFFDDYEPDYGAVIFSPVYYTLWDFFNEQPTNLPIIPSIIQKTQFDDYDWNKNFDLNYGPITFEEDTGLRPILVSLPIDEGLDQKLYALYYVPQQPPNDDDFSFQGNFPPPPLPTNERNEEESWQHFLGYQLSQGTAEEDVPPNLTIPTLAWDEIDWQRYFDLIYSTAMQQEQMEDQTYGWFLNPPIPPPPPFCPLPPFGPDADVNMSIFGGASHPTLALFCRICNSGKPLVVRADYAIWCQDCCAFVSKQDTYMGTIRAPGVFKNVF